MEQDEMRYFKRMDLTISDPKTMCTVAHALSTDLRLKILALINSNTLNVIEIADALDVPVSTVAVNIAVLEKANLVKTKQVTGVHGMQKRCVRLTDSVSINLIMSRASLSQTGEIPMPIGLYSRCEGIQPSCGLATTDDYIGLQDEPLYFYAPARQKAQILWFHQGFVEYRFPVVALRNERLSKIEISFEACSEAIGYDNYYRSDISVLINGLKIGVWTSPSDFGGRRGVLNPSWWPDFSSQFGMLKNWSISSEGSYLDNIKLSSVTLADLHIDEKPYLSLSIGVEPNAEHVGGVNLFGSGFGDIPQDILLRYYIT
jgi:predicted transcriptional regulator